MSFLDAVSLGIDAMWQVLELIVKNVPYVGAVLVTAIIILILLTRYGILPKITRWAAFALLLVFLGIVFVALILPTFERIWFGTEHVNVVLVDGEGKAISDTFTLTYLVEGHDPREVDGKNGMASISGVPAGATTLDIVRFSGTPLHPREDGPFPIQNGRVRIVMIPASVELPNDDADRPDPTVFRPPTETLKETSAADPTKVVLHIENKTGQPLTLVLSPYRVEEKQPNPWKLEQRWIDISLPDSLERIHDGFKTGSGWFGLWALDKNHKYWPLGAKNLFIAKHVQIVIKPDTDTSATRPFACDVNEIKVPPAQP